MLQPDFLVGTDLAAGTLIELMPEYRALELGIYALYPTRKHVAPKVRALIDFLTGQFAAQNAAAIVFHADEANPTCQQPQRDLPGPRIERVVHKLAHHRSGAFDDFTCRNLADEFVRQFKDRGARRGGRNRWCLGGGLSHRIIVCSDG